MVRVDLHQATGQWKERPVIRQWEATCEYRNVSCYGSGGSWLLLTHRRTGALSPVDYGSTGVSRSGMKYQER